MMMWIDLGNIEDVIGFDDYIKERLAEKQKIIDEQQSTINELQSIINHIKCEEDCFDYDYCCETVCSLYNEIKHLKEENKYLKKRIEVISDELYCKDRKLEELGVPIECCDKK